MGVHLFLTLSHLGFSVNIKTHLRVLSWSPDQQGLWVQVSYSHHIQITAILSPDLQIEGDETFTEHRSFRYTAVQSLSLSHGHVHDLWQLEQRWKWAYGSYLVSKDTHRICQSFSLLDAISEFSKKWPRKKWWYNLFQEQFTSTFLILPWSYWKTSFFSFYLFIYFSD